MRRVGCVAVTLSGETSLHWCCWRPEKIERPHEALNNAKRPHCHETRDSHVHWPTSLVKLTGRTLTELLVSSSLPVQSGTTERTDPVLYWPCKVTISRKCTEVGGKCSANLRAGQKQRERGTCGVEEDSEISTWVMKLREKYLNSRQRGQLQQLHRVLLKRLHGCSHFSLPVLMYLMWQYDPRRGWL